MPVISFDARTLDRTTPADPDGRQIDYWGKDEAGLGLRVGRRGKVWMLNIRRPGSKSSSRLTPRLGCVPPGCGPTRSAASYVPVDRSRAPSITA